jgi:hypothetical protein
LKDALQSASAPVRALLLPANMLPTAPPGCRVVWPMD